jgi:hypothetical protein
VELGGARWPRIGGCAGELGRLEVGDRADSRGPVVRGMRARWLAQEGVNQKGKRTSANTPSTCGLAGPAGLDSTRERREASGSQLGRRPGGPQGRPGRKQGKRISKLKIGFLNLPRHWKFVEGDLGRILT